MFVYHLREREEERRGLSIKKKIKKKPVKTVMLVILT